MRLLHWLTISITTTVVLIAPLAADEYCDHLSAFERAKFDPAANSARRHWVEVHWVGEWLFGKILCKHSDDEASTTYCSWLTDHSSLEFPDRLPRSILVCHGYRFPDLSYWSSWKAKINLFNKSDHLMLLDIDLTAHKTEDVAIRLSVFDKGADNATHPLPPLFNSSDAGSDDPLH